MVIKNYKIRAGASGPSGLQIYQRLILSFKSGTSQVGKGCLRPLL